MSIITQYDEQRCIKEAIQGLFEKFFSACHLDHLAEDRDANYLTLKYTVSSFKNNF